MRFRKANLIAALTALFVLHAPLCAVACLPSTDSMAAAAMAEHAHDGAAPAMAEHAHDGAAPAMAERPGAGDAPCHGAPDSRAPSKSHDDCGCDEAAAAVFVGSAKSSSIGPLVATLPNAAFVAWSASDRLASTGERLETDLPPPDLLLLKSSWLL